jgi:transcriptional antiterminator RfaH
MTAADPSMAAAQARPWYVCFTKPRQERTAQARLLEQGYEVYLPLLPVWKQRSAGAWERADEIMFPRYAFVRPGDERQALGPVRSTPGVTSLVRFGNVMGCLAPQRLDALRELVRLREQAAPGQPLQPGAAVVFSSGPLKGLGGLVSSVAAERVTVMMSLLGREKAVSVPVHQLSPA